MKLNESTFRRILCEESIKFLREESAKPGAVIQVWDATKQAFNPNFVSKEDETGKGAGALDIATAGISTIASGFDPSAQVVLVGALSSYIRATAVKKIAGAGGVGAPGVTLVANAAVGGEAGTAAIAAAGGGATGVALGVLAPVALGMLGTYMLGRIASEGWIAYKVGNSQAETNARTAFQSAVISIYTDIITRAIQNKTFTKEQIVASGASGAVFKFARGEALTASEKSIMTLIFSGADSADVYKAWKPAFAGAPKVTFNILTTKMQISASEIYQKTLKDLFSKLSSQIKEFKAAAKASAAVITAKQQAAAKVKVDQDKRYRDTDLQKTADRVEFEQGRVPSSYKAVPVGTAAKAAGAKAPAAPATKKLGT